MCGIAAIAEHKTKLTPRISNCNCSNSNIQQQHPTATAIAIAIEEV